MLAHQTLIGSEASNEPFAREEIDRVFSKTDAKTVLGARNTAIVSLMFDTGLSLSEVASR